MSDKLIYNPTPKYGEWIVDEIDYDDTLKISIYKCSKCEAISYRKSNYCPDCGANMTRRRERKYLNTHSTR